MTTRVGGTVLMAVVIVPVLLLGGVAGFVYWLSMPHDSMLTVDLMEPLDGARTASVDINAGDGNLMIDALTGGEQLLAGGTLQYFEKHGPPPRELITFLGQATFTLKGSTSERSWFRLLRDARNGATEWQIHLNPTVSSDITAHSDGGNVRLDLARMAVTRVSADTSGGDLEVVLPQDAADLSVTAETGGGSVSVEIGSGTTGSNVVNASSGAGNVVVRVPSGMDARIHASSGMGKVIVDPRFGEAGDHIYESPGYDSAANKVEITANSGAGNTSVRTR